MTRPAIVTVALLALLTAAAMAAYVHTVRAFHKSVQGVWQAMHTVTDSVSIGDEHNDAWAPILWNGDTIGKVVAIGHIAYGHRSMRIYRGLLTGRPPAYQPESLAAIDASDAARHAHELRLVPRRAVGDTTRWLGTLTFEHVHEGIPVLAARN